MKELIESALGVLVSQPLVSATRAANMQMFGFGRWVDTTHGERRKVGEFALHLQCVWRIVEYNRIVVAQRDMYYPSGDPDVEPDSWDWDKAGANKCDEQTKRLMARYVDAPLVVRSVAADCVGGFRLALGEGFTLEVFPDNSLADEHWRFFRATTEEEHFIVSGEGIEGA